jgi:Mg2+/Co2+ transporter CorB
MTIELTITLAVILLLLVLSAFFSGSETAFTAASRARMHALEKDGDKRAALVNRLVSTPERLIGAILIGNNLVNILASALATSVFLGLFGSAGVAYATLAMTALVVVFSEVLPKTYAITSPDRVAMAVAPLLRFIVTLLSPLTSAVQLVVRAILGHSVEGASERLVSAHEELRGAIDLHHQEGGVVKHDRDMLGGILDLRELEVTDVMVHRTKMQSVNADDPPQKLVDEILKSPYSRLPVWKDEPENIVGVLHVKDLLRELPREETVSDDFDFLELASDAWFVPETTSLKNQLNAFLKRKTHFALVVDEYGEVMGLVTLEDILEEIVGQIADEHDVPDAAIRPQADGTVNVDGTVPIRDINRRMDWDLPDDEATTIAGLVIHEAQTIPEPGQAFTFYGFRFEILRKQRNQVTALRVTPLDRIVNQRVPA